MAKKSLLSRVPKRGRDEITTIMEERDGDLPLGEFLAKRWDFRQFYLDSDRGRYSEKRQKQLNEYRAQWAQRQPEWTDDMADTAVSLSCLTQGLKDWAVARRFVLEDPADLARGLSVLNRLQWLFWRCDAYATFDFEKHLECFAVRDVLIAQRLADGPEWPEDEPSDFDVCTDAVVAVVRQDFDRLRSVAAGMARRKGWPWMQGFYTCLTGVAEDNPAMVSEGLSLNLDGLRRMRQKTELQEAINLDAQGLYRLCEWVSPALVEGFDASQPFPWDADFHAWCQEHPDPLEGVDLSGISPIFHEAVVRLSLPAWWPTKPKPAGAPKDLCEVVLTAAGERLVEIVPLIRYLAGGSEADARRMAESCPVVIRSDIYRGSAEDFCRQLQAAGGSAEVRTVKPWRS
jgi:ribosomal protein L7/L12